MLLPQHFPVKIVLNYHKMLLENDIFLAFTFVVKMFSLISFNTCWVVFSTRVILLFLQNHFFCWFCLYLSLLRSYNNNNNNNNNKQTNMSSPLPPRNKIRLILALGFFFALSHLTLITRTLIYDVFTHILIFIIAIFP